MSKTAPILNGNGDFLNSGLLDIFSPFFTCLICLISLAIRSRFPSLKLNPWTGKASALSDGERFLSKVTHFVIFGRENLSVERHKFSVWVKQRQMSPSKRPPFLKCSLYQCRRRARVPSLDQRQTLFFKAGATLNSLLVKNESVRFVGLFAD
jgi:hypothetical protein